MSRVDSKSLPPRNLPLLMTVVFLACLSAMLTGAKLGFGGAAALLAAGAALALRIPKRRLELDYRMGYAGLAAALLLIANLPWAALILTGLQFGGIGREAAGGRARPAFAFAWLGLAAGSLGYWALGRYVSAEHAPAAVGAVAASAGAALWFRLARSRRWRAVGVALALVAVAVLLFRIRQADALRPSSPMPPPEPWEWLLPIAAFTGTLTLLLRSRAAAGTDRLLTYLGLSSLALGMIAGVAGQGILPLFDQPELGGLYLSGAIGLLSLGASLGAWFWIRTDRPQRWTLWLLASAASVAGMAILGPSLLLLDVMLGWPFPWPWLIALMLGGFVLGPIPAAGFRRLPNPALGPWAAAILILMAAAGHQGAVVITQTVGAAQTALAAAGLLLVSMMVAGSWNRLHPGK